MKKLDKELNIVPIYVELVLGFFILQATPNPADLHKIWLEDFFGVTLFL